MLLCNPAFQRPWAHDLRMRWPPERPRKVQLLLLLVALVAGCGGGGSDRARVADAVRGYLGAIADRDGHGACELLTRDAQLSVFRTKRAHAGADHPAQACATVVRSFAPLYGPARLRGVTVSQIKVDGDRARARADGVPIELERVSGEWKLSVSGVGQAVGDTPPRQSG